MSQVRVLPGVLDNVINLILFVDEKLNLCYDDIMYSKPKTVRPQAIRRGNKRRNKQTTLTFLLVSVALLTMPLGIRLFTQTSPPPEPTPVHQIEQPAIALPPTVSADTAIGPAALPPIHAIVGIVSGHRGYDPGAVCDDGLTEAEINFAISQEVVNLLTRRGIQSDLLDEYDPRLTDYQADALVSIHADSCNIAGASGFKVARVTDSAIPQAEDKLVACLTEQYGLYTNLPQHPASITDNMTNYHAFNEIAPHTPGAIIETGFLLDDRFILESKSKVVARGIAAGILCFLEQSLQ